LEHKGHIHRNGERMRAMEVVDKTLLRGHHSVVLPLVGRVSAGPPSLADEHVEEHVEVPRGILGDVSGCFLLRVRGDSMIGAGIMPDDVVVVRRQPVASPGDVVVALFGEEATVKKFALDEGTPILIPANPAYALIRKEFLIIGRVVGLLRAYRGGYGCS
jgi:repressor LexA